MSVQAKGTVDAMSISKRTGSEGVFYMIGVMLKVGCLNNQLEVLAIGMVLGVWTKVGC